MSSRQFCKEAELKLLKLKGREFQIYTTLTQLHAPAGCETLLSKMCSYAHLLRAVDSTTYTK